jgi:hypothetical protein
MKRRHPLYLAVIVALGMAMQPGSAVAQQKTLKGQRAQSGSLELAADKDWKHYFTVLTMAPDGEWGVATEMFINRAIAGAISDCKSKYRREIGCGYQITSIRAGWSVSVAATKILLQRHWSKRNRLASIGNSNLGRSTCQICRPVFGWYQWTLRVRSLRQMWRISFA